MFVSVLFFESVYNEYQLKIHCSINLIRWSLYFMHSYVIEIHESIRYLVCHLSFSCNSVLAINIILICVRIPTCTRSRSEHVCMRICDIYTLLNFKKLDIDAADLDFDIGAALKQDWQKTNTILPCASARLNMRFRHGRVSAVQRWHHKLWVNCDHAYDINVNRVPVAIHGHRNRYMYTYTYIYMRMRILCVHTY